MVNIEDDNSAMQCVCRNSKKETKKSIRYSIEFGCVSIEKKITL